MLVVTHDDVSKLHKALKTFAPQALPYAAKAGLNTAAFAARREWAAEGKRTMTVRNQFTFGRRNHRVVQARLQKRIASMESVVGNKNRYMDEQEHGVRRFALFRKGVPIPTTKSRIARANTRLVRKVFWRKAIKLGKRYKRTQFDNTSQYVAATIERAKRSGSEFAYLEFSERKRGIYDVSTKTKTKLIWNMSRKSTFTKPNPMLRRSLATTHEGRMTYTRMALEFEIRRALKKRGFRVRGPNVLAELSRFQSAAR